MISFHVLPYFHILPVGKCKEKENPDDPNEFQLRCFLYLERVIKCVSVKTIILSAAEKTNFMCLICMCVCVSLCS